MGSEEAGVVVLGTGVEVRGRERGLVAYFEGVEDEALVVIGVWVGGVRFRLHYST